MSIGVSERKIYSDKQASVEEEANLSLKNTYKRLSYFGVMNLSWSPTIIGGSIILYGSYYKDFDKKYAFEGYKINAVNIKEANRNNKSRPDLLSVNVEYNSKDTLHNRFKLSYGLLTGNSNLKENYSNTILQYYNLQNKFWGHQHILEARYTYQVGKCIFKLGLQDYMSVIHQRDIIESYNYSSNIKLSENIFAVYSSIGYALSKKLYLYMGWRSEYTDYRQKPYTVSYHENYWENSPSFSFSYNVSDNYKTSLKLNTRSHRTSFYNILPGIGFQSDNEYSTGNPNLRPENIYDVRWENLIFKYLNVRLSCKYIKDCWDIWYSLNGEDTRYTTYINFGDQIGYYIYTSIPFSFFSGKLRGTLNFNGLYERYVNIEESVKDCKFIGKNRYWNFQGNMFVGYTPNKHLSIYLNPFISSKYSSLQTSSRRGMVMNCGVQYSLMKDDALTISMAINDLFDNAYGKQLIYYKTREVHNYTFSNSMNAMLTVSFNISRNKKSIKVNRNANDISRFEK